ncbi:HAD family hydrolase [Anaeromicropila herbilytica]|uniref:Phosphorylated carbohydrates phosphatase n=1 Tax=Anaeromicropila herbilytica TaxID=2785025 RepID=A0A7R7EKM7_9FIRM|nr:HAD-IA family hydrolase [Anaeromicropila herbilytica]BCN30197.1 phosphorylated carbohydrates phosphatase [Anaeromicropila herbilytica]
MIKAVIFDMDGLMFDTERLMMLAWDYAGEKMGLGKTGHMVLKTLGMNRILSREVWKEEYGEVFKAEELDLYTNEFFEHYYSENDVPVKTGLYELLSYLREHHYKIGAASSTYIEKVKHHLNNAKILEYFDVVVGGDMVEKSKPDPQIYQKASELLGVKPDSCYALEDSRNGLLAAYRAGCKPIMIPDLWQPDEEISRILYAKRNNLSEVIDILKDNHNNNC